MLHWSSVRLEAAHKKRCARVRAMQACHARHVRVVPAHSARVMHVQYAQDVCMMCADASDDGSRRRHELTTT